MLVIALKTILILHTFQQSFQHIKCTSSKYNFPIGFDFKQVGYNPRQITPQNQQTYQDRIRENLQKIVAEGTHYPYSLRSYRQDTTTETANWYNLDTEADLLDHNPDYFSYHLEKDPIHPATRCFIPRTESYQI